MEGGVLQDKTLTEDYLEVTFDDSSTEEESGFNSIYVNGEAHVKELAQQTSNGMVYVMDDVIRPMIESAYEQLY